MVLLDLPAELRIHIYSYLPDLRPGRRVVVASRFRLLPSICQVSRQIRHETIPIYARNCDFAFGLYDSLDIGPWIYALGSMGLSSVQCVQLSHHWKILRPSQGQGHVGFYVRIERPRDDDDSNAWRCTTGTSPFARDRRGLRFESIELLRRVILDAMARGVGRGTAESRLEFTASDFSFITAAMEIVASHPIEVYDLDLSETSTIYKQRIDIWLRMERRLLALDASKLQPLPALG